MSLALTSQLAELHLLQCSLLPGESFSFILPTDDLKEWSELLRNHIELEDSDFQSSLPASTCRFEVRVKDAPIWLEVELPRGYPMIDAPLVYIRGEEIDRTQQERWQKIVRNEMNELQQEKTEFLVQTLLCMTTLPLLHQLVSVRTLGHADTSSVTCMPSASGATESHSEPVYHALLTSHHLISSKKRRILQKWAPLFSLRGFAKIGYPGCIYAEGARADLLDFITSVKGFQWLALHVRFVEPLSGEHSGQFAEKREDGHSWVELERIGEVVEYMRRLGREQFVTEMGLGSSASTSST
ncbi:hypothetical protein EW145_g568 [Phellinidium pouzarii]|uniref:Uncharacterized protein n=1 Tax=Phellinidium pouzarii TaxID=167371 RepID=A0A4S4LHY6_9AGAM|nr:hypothetical protein EW145_g568 [Phellinidium pouzarii]